MNRSPGLWVLLLLLNCPLLSVAQTGKVAITNIQVFTEPFIPPIENATILISRGKFGKIGPADRVKIPKGYQIVKGEGKYATAGYWNSHVHFMEAKWNNAAEIPGDSLEAMFRDMFTSRGFVYVFDLAQIDFQNLNLLRTRAIHEKLKSPTILAVGVPFTSKSPFYIEPLRLPELKSAEEVRGHINDQLRQGANGIKIWTASPTGPRIDYLPEALIREAARLTSQLQIPLFAHPTNLRGVEMAVDNGVSVLAHVAADDRVVWDSVLVEKMVTRDVALIPTLKLHFWDLRMAGIPPANNPLTNTAVAQLRAFHQKGGLVLFGTDVGYMDDYDIVEELTRMQMADMRFDQILASLTLHPARRFDHSGKTGKIGAGKRADLVILNENPALDIRGFSKVHMTIHNGRIIYHQGVDEQNSP